MDANNGSEQGLGEVQDLIDQCQLVEIYVEKHKNETDFPTHENESRKIDFLFGTRNLIPHIEKVRYLHYDEAFETDHHAIFCDISSEILSPNLEPEIGRARIIGTNSTNLEGEKYIRELDKKFREHNIYEKTNNIYNEILKHEFSEEKIVS
jgi:glycosylphosphatidylinositol transamidase (GPIT) subunit GPI8